jgi:hypothetical protein
LPSENALPGDDFSVRWTGQLLPPESGRYEIVVGANDGFRLFLEGRELIDGWEPNERVRSRSVTIDLEAGRAYDLRLEYFEDIRDAEVRLAWRRPARGRRSRKRWRCAASRRNRVRRRPDRRRRRRRDEGELSRLRRR